MKRFCYFVSIALILVVISFGIYKYNNRYNLNIVNNNIQWSIYTKGSDDIRTFDFDEQGNLYIADRNCIKYINGDNEEKVILSDESFYIWDINVVDKSIFIASNSSVFQYDLSRKIYYEIITDLPNTGLNKEINLISIGDKLLITVGSNTNAGVVESIGDSWDKPSFQWISTGKSYGSSGTGAFSPFGTYVKEGQVMKEEVLSNASIVSYDTNTKQISTFATGIRNVEGIDYSSENKIIAVVGGIENSGQRHIECDTDYLYEIKEKAWYGWPDFSGGDPINSARFSNVNEKSEFLIANHPTEVVYGPIYQHDSVSSLKGLAIDKEGSCFEKDTMVIADNNEKKICKITKEGIMNDILKLEDVSKVERIRYYKGEFFVLDSGTGCIYKIVGGKDEVIFNLPKVIWIFSITFLVVIVVCIGIKINKNNK